jgi:ABC-2 type transport system ATP-binding protein
MHDPDVIILDEPTSGLDPLMQKVFIEIVLEEKARGKTFLIESHEGDRVRVAVQGNYDKFLEETAKIRVRNIDIFTQNLEDIFMNYYDREGTMK